MTPAAEAKLLELLGEVTRALRGFTETQALKEQVLRLEASLVQHGERLNRVEDDVAQQDETYVEDLKKKLTEREGSAQHWVRYVVGVVVSLLVVVFSALMGYYLKK